MSQYPPGSLRTIMAVDMADFTNPFRTSFHRIAMQEGLHEALRTAFEEAGVDWAGCEVESRGDGYLILAPPNCPNSVLADQMSKRLLAELLRHNARHAVEVAIQLRVALHTGEVRGGKSGWDGDALNHTFRILEAEAAKTDLRRTKGVLAMIVSDLFYREVVQADPANEPGAFHRIPVLVKHTDDFAWLRVQGLVRILIEESRPLAVIPDIEMQRLRELLGDTSPPQLPALAARATGHGMPPMRRAATAWDVVQYLLDLNAGPDGLSPVIVFIELLAATLGGPVADRLTAWNDTQARHPTLVAALRLFRESREPVANDDTPLHLTILIDHDGADPDHFCLMSYWRQDDPQSWPPPLGDTRIVPVVDIEREVDRLVLGSEAAWSEFRGPVGLEFVLPRSLLHVPVEMWRKELDSADPQPLSLDYPVVVRSLERMRAPHWHRQWRNRWSVLTKKPAEASIHFATKAEIVEPYRMEMSLKDPHVVGIVLSTAPRADVPARDELTVALRSGMPIVIWAREDANAPLGVDELATVVAHMAESDGLADLPRRMLSARQAVFGGLLEEHIAPEAVHKLVLLWDDPGRLVILDQPSVPRRPRGDSADEREQAS